MIIIVAQSTGFCSGVRRAISGTERALEEREKIFCLGEIIHNRRVVEELKLRGLVVVDDIGSVPDGSAFIVRSHGLPVDQLEKARSKNLTIFDFSCPKVKKTHRLVVELSRDGYFIFIAGNPEHPEVKAIHSLAERNSVVVQSPEDMKHLDSLQSPRDIKSPQTFTRLAFPEKNAVVVQTTFDPLRFLDIVKETVSLSKTTLVCNTLCEETLKRQREAVELTSRVDFVVVVGGKNSSNTRTLFEMVRARVPVLHIEESVELDPAQFHDVNRVGIVSGASTPEEEVMEVVRRLESFQ